MDVSFYLQLKIRNNFTTLLNHIQLFTDGSASPQYGVGAWAACLVGPDGEQELKGTARAVTHHTMELQPVIEGLQHLRRQGGKVDRVVVYSDSQYVADLPERRSRLESAGYLTQKGKEVKNRQLIRQLFELLDRFSVVMRRVPSHSKAGESEITDYNRKVDKLSRELVRQMIRGDQ